MSSDSYTSSDSEYENLESEKLKRKKKFSLKIGME